MARKQSKAQRRRDALTKAGATVRSDGWQNFTTGLGTVRDKRTHARFGGAMVFQGGQFLDELYAGDDMIARIVDLPAQEMTREWIEIRAGEDADAAKGLVQRLDDLDLQSKTEEALAWARLHGGALMVLGVDDGKDPMEPLDEKNIRSFRWVTVLDRWEVQVHETYDDPHDPRYGKPKVYRIEPTSESGGVAKQSYVHESRTIRFDGIKTPRRRMRLLQGWSDSIVTRVYEVVRDFGQSYAGAAAALTDFSQAVVKLKGLASMLAADHDDVVLKRIQMMDMARSIARLVPMDAENESFEIVTRTLAGLPETLDRLAQRLSAATDIPVTKLMGMSPAGLNATGASDIRFWYDAMRARQESELRPKLGRIVELVFRAKDGPTGGVEPEDWSLEFRPLWQSTEREQADTRYVVAQTDRLYVDMGAVDPAEIAMSRFGGDRWSMETSIDLEGREGEPDEPTDLLLSEGDAPAPGGAMDDVQKTALNGAQIQSLVGVVSAVARREIPRDSGIATLRRAFLVSAEEAEELLGEAGKSFEPAGGGEGTTAP